MKITLLDHTQNAVVQLGRVAAICYDAKLDDESCIRRAIKCKDSGHLSVLRFAYATFNVSGISRICSHQIVRMAHAGILQRCVVGDTLVAVVNNEKSGDIKWMPIRRMFDLQNGARGSWNWKARVRVFDENSRTFAVSTVKEVFHNGTKPVFCVEAETGLSITCTEHHKFLTKNGFKPLAELDVGDYIARNGVPAYRDRDWMAESKEQSIADGTGVSGIAEKAGVSYHTVRAWLRKHGLQFSKKETAMYTRPWNEGLSGDDIPWTGRKHSHDQREKVSDAKLGAANPSWRGGVTKPRMHIANRTSSRLLTREAVFERDGHTCRVCGAKENLQIDHIKSVREFPELAFDVENLQTLCKTCHKTKSVEESNRVRKTVRWVKIVGITAKGEQEVYDMEVEHTSHNYVANKTCQTIYARLGHTLRLHLSLCIN